MSTTLAVDIRPVGLDHLADLRRIHALSYRSHLGTDLSEDQADALLDFIQTPEYVELILKTESQGAWIEGRLCATASWMPGAAAGGSAKIIGVCVDPLFGGLGLGRRLVEAVEKSAKRAGFAVMSVRTPLSSSAFFEKLGYAGTSRGVWAMSCGVAVPVLHMRKGEVQVPLAAAPRLAMPQRVARAPAASRVN